MIVLYQFEISPFCDKIRRILNHKKVPYRTEEIPLLGTMTTLRRINPIGKVPCIDDGGHLVADSSDIARYLEEKYPSPALYPSSPKDRALCHVLEDWADESLYFYEVRMRLTFPNNRDRTFARLTAREPAAVQKLAPLVLPLVMRHTAEQQGIGRKPEAMVVSEAARHCDAIAELLGESSFLIGDALTIADISVFAQLDCIRGTDEGGPMIAARPALSAWMDRVDQATRA
ncbi:MAG: glutathione S-transferase family protein [Minicystis sp.]